MPMTCTGGRLRCFNPYSTARFTMVATLFQFKLYCRAVPCQLNSRASRATALDRAVVTRAHGSAQGKSSTRTPHCGHSTRRGRYRNFSGNFRIDKSSHTRGFCTLCTLRHRCRQSPQRRSRLPRRSIWTTMKLSVSSTSVTVWAFNPNCFLRNVSMSTSIPLLKGVHHTLTQLDESGIHDAHFPRKSLHERHFNFNHTLGRGAIFGSPIHNPSDVTAIALGNPWGLLNSLVVFAIRDGTGRFDCPTSLRVATDDCCENAAVPFVRAKLAPMPLVRNSRLVTNAASTCCAAIARWLCANPADDVADYTTFV